MDLGLRGHRRTYHTIFKKGSAWSANFKMVWYVLLRPLRPELDGQDPFQIMESCVKLFIKTRPLEKRAKHPLFWCSVSMRFALSPRHLNTAADKGPVFVQKCRDVLDTIKGVLCTKGLIILLSRQLVVATTTKPRLGHLAPASEVEGGHSIPF
jgi:hypothetical protein